MAQVEPQRDHNGNHQVEALEEPADSSNDNTNTNNRFRSEEDVVSVVLPESHPDRMKLTRQEHDGALQIKDMIEGLPDLDDLNDFWYGQLAIICKDNIDDAVERCYAMQEFRHEYRIEDRQQQANRVLSQHFELFPRNLLSFSFSDRDGTYVFVHDLAQFDPKQFTRPGLRIDWLVTMYYSHILFFPDFESVRRGIYCVVECKDMGMRSDVLKCFSQFFEEFLTHYPFVGKCHHYHTGTMLNVICSILRKVLLKRELQDSFLVGLEFDGHMSETFFTPTVEEANRRMLARMKETLQMRYENEKSFSLEE